jgi:hypothetical protein
VERGVLARAAASRRGTADGAPAAAPPAEAGQRDGAGKGSGDVIQSVEVDWGAPQTRP